MGTFHPRVEFSFGEIDPGRELFAVGLAPLGDRQDEIEALVKEGGTIKGDGAGYFDRLESACFEHLHMAYVLAGEDREYLNGSWRDDLASSGRLRGLDGFRFLARCCFRSSGSRRGRGSG